MDYYVYVYLDPRKTGNFVYGDYSFDCEPFYIGKGRKSRSRIHLLKVKGGKYSNLPKYHTIKDILDCGYEPVILKYMENMLESDAFKLEMNMIRDIGRKNMNLGPLRNLTDGGEGNGNRIFTDEHRKNISIAKKGKSTENLRVHLAKIHNRMIGNKRTLGFKFSSESIEKLIKSHMKPIVKKDTSGNFIEKFDSIKQAKEITGINPTKALSGKGHTAGGFIWEYWENN
jgi:hypothetical protein